MTGSRKHPGGKTPLVTLRLDVAGGPRAGEAWGGTVYREDCPTPEAVAAEIEDILAKLGTIAKEAANGRS